MSLEIGQIVGDYRVEGILGAGGMGEVYKVRNTISDRIDAMKVLLPSLLGDQELADRFLREIRVQASLEHPNIAALRTAQRVDDQILMIMEYVEGTTIEAALKSGPLPLAEGADAVRQVLLALTYAHARGVIHRDIKPANMMRTQDGTVKLMDFGIARITADRRLTQTGRTVGSLYYMSPEQIRGETNLDARSDLYSLGVSLYEILTGARPFQGDSDYSIMAAHLQQTPVPPVEVDPRLPPALSEVIMTAIAKDPAQRFQSADAFRVALESAAGIGPAAAAPAPVAAAPPPAPPPSRRGLYMVLGSLLTILVLIGAAIQIPKWIKARAGAPPVVTAPAETAPQPPPVPEAPPPSPPPVQVQEAPPPQAPAPVVKAPAAQPPRARTERVSKPLAPAPAVAPAAAVPAEQPPAPAAVPKLPTQDTARQTELREGRQRMMLMATRISTVKVGLENLRREQARSGLGLRADMVTASQRVEFHMDEAEAALKAGNPADVKRSLDAAERELEKLERFLGH